MAASGGCSPDALIKTVAGGKKIEVRGTYVHFKLIPHIASWVSAAFAIKVSDIVEEYFVKKAVAAKDKLLKNKDDKISELLGVQKKMMKKYDESQKHNDVLKQNIETLLGKADQLIGNTQNIQRQSVALPVQDANVIMVFFMLSNTMTSLNLIRKATKSQVTNTTSFVLKKYLPNQQLEKSPRNIRR